MNTRIISIINAAGHYRHAHTELANRIASQTPDTLVVPVGRGSLLEGRIKTGECWPCTLEGRPEQLPDLWFWEPLPDGRPDQHGNPLRR